MFSLILLLLLCLAPPSIRTDPLDLERFAISSRADTLAQLQCAYEFHAGIRSSNTLPLAHWALIEAESRRRYFAWDALDSAAAHITSAEFYINHADLAEFTTQIRLCVEDLAQLRGLIGWRNYYNGRMPEPIPFELFLERP